MNLVCLFFLVAALLTVALLLWAVRPPKRRHFSPEKVFAALSKPRHCSRLPQILQSLRPADTEFLELAAVLISSGVCVRNANGRHSAILIFFKRTLRISMEASRVLAVMSPEVIAMQEV